MPVEESDEVAATAEKYGIDPIFLVTQTTSNERMDTIVRHARGYLYLVSVLGVTGARKTVAPEALALLNRVRSHTDLPLAIGFGISTPEHVTTCNLAGADGVIVGSAIVDIVEKNLGNPDAMEQDLRRYVSVMKKAAEQ
jgi:tryptophan synthase alpha chain